MHEQKGTKTKRVRQNEERHQIFAIKKRRHWVQDSIVDLQCRSMKYNFVFTGQGWETKEEVTESKLRDYIYFELGVDWKMEFCNVHRFGRSQQNRIRPIVAKFLCEIDRLSLLERADKLKGSGLFFYRKKSRYVSIQVLI